MGAGRHICTRDSVLNTHPPASRRAPCGSVLHLRDLRLPSDLVAKRTYLFAQRVHRTPQHCCLSAIFILRRLGRGDPARPHRRGGRVGLRRRLRVAVRRRARLHERRIVEPPA